MRAFIAIDVEGARVGWGPLVEAVKAALGPEAKKWSFTRPATLHLTLAFLGEIAEIRGAEAEDALLETAARHRAFTLGLAGLGAFPSASRPKVLWVGAREGAEALTAIALDLAGALRARSFALEERAFHPHLTLARARRDARARSVERLVQDSASVDLGRWPIGELVLYRSELRSGGAEHHVLARAPLSQLTASALAT